MAALNLCVEAQTLHIFCGLLDDCYTPSQMKERISSDEALQKVRVRLAQTDVLIIDEASLISARVPTLVDEALRAAKHSQKPFAGVNLIAVLNPLQLPPIPNAFYDDNGLFPFTSLLWQSTLPHLSQSVVASWQQFPLVLAYALTIHKAQGLEQPAVEADVQAMLGVEISRVISLDHLQILDNCKKSQEKMTIQYRIQNDENFRRIEDELMRYDWSAISKGNTTPKVLALKVGSRVMLVRNMDQDASLAGQRSQSHKVLLLPGSSFHLSLRMHLRSTRHKAWSSRPLRRMCKVFEGIRRNVALLDH
ncbi:hypothetical protein CAPTEDRAFT_213238 [Capitella teleta]|uniref:DNA helicase Pif1-like 2B domain-containing protein n=1 Tax=Capitella teleta TaxID=283909 RepID=R7UQE7_CAPTE|nr:hypothetical protein CAPTEDRAFT_213238 [Capitella teleta]|eukprot:ELU08338.1 hypothetical protein CAPTEDRAFT_213238 [Capitella teleta]